MRVTAQDERGFTLVELLVAMACGSLVLWSSMLFVASAMTSGAQTADRVDTTERARQSLDAIIRDLQGQVCLAASQPPLAAADASWVTFTADLSGSGAAPTMVRYAFDPTAGTITRTLWVGTGAPPATTWSSSGLSTTVLSGVSAAPGIPVFRYYAYSASSPATATVALPTPLSAADLARVVRVSVSFVVQPDRTGRVDARATTLADDAWAGAADGNAASAGPGC